MARYAKQIDKYSCGPTAIINAIKWSGAPVSYRAMRSGIINHCSTNKEGTAPDLLNQGIGWIFPNYGIKVTNYIQKSCRGFLQHARQGGAVIIRFRWPHHDTGHYVLVTNATQHFVDVVNLYSKGPAKQRISRRTFARLLVNRPLLHCWHLTKT